MNQPIRAKQGTKKLFSEGHTSLHGILQELLLTRTEREVADLLGMSLAWVSSRMVGGLRNRPIHKVTLRKLATRLGMTVEALAPLVVAPLQNSHND